MGAFVAHLHGRPWKSYHRQAADVIGERLHTGHYRYPIVVVTFPRQCGKTTFVMDLAIGRGLQQLDYRAAYAAQTGHKTTENFGARFTELEDGPLAETVRLRRSAGTERIRLPGRSYLKAFPPKAGALRSDALDLVIVDEAQEHDELLGRALDATIIPTFTTRPRRQLILVGTAGTERSAYLARYLEQARAGVAGYAVVEFGASDEVDFLDPAVWPTVHPGLAYGLTDTAALAQALMGPAGFLREYGNVWTKTSVRLVAPEEWAAVQLPAETPRPAGRICLSVALEADRSAAAVGVGAADGYRELVDARPGVDWVTGRVTELAATYGAPVALDRYGATGTVADELERAGVPLLVLKTLDVANAAATFLDQVRNRSARIYPAAALTEAVAGAAMRPLGDTGGFAWSHRDSAAPVAPLVAICGAGWGFEHLPPPAVRPAVYAT
jgi:hypothetical protein